MFSYRIYISIEYIVQCELNIIVTKHISANKIIPFFGWVVCNPFFMSAKNGEPNHSPKHFSHEKGKERKSERV